MKKFVFDLEDILEFRKFEQQQAEIELGKALSKEKEIQDKIDTLALQKVTVQKEIKNSTDFTVLSQSTKYFEFIKKQTEFLLNQIAEAKLVTEQKREVLQKCMQRTDALEDLKKDQLAEYNKLVLDEEDKENDDIVTSRTGHFSSKDEENHSGGSSSF